MSDLSDRNARLLALIVPLALLGGAYVSEYGFGLYPCEMCWWQRYPHFVAVVLALLAFVVPPKRLWTALAGLAIAVSGAIGLFHAGVEYGWWEGITGCATTVSGTGNALEAVLNSPIIRCDVAQWDLFGISLAGWNALFSLGSAVAIWVLLLAKERTR
ncbi:disulfide bond formation protein B [Aurantiacibacter xanthus]|uniref:Disulfide bond formation protein B n=1 Tax=Aurantiacibacter xanthus TaxID=1784712 RepID=A0A3A1P960_9SPHN|nr:disulfide bond formation protein B [Aurantiacibacter xanthus]RIV90113.1 disulfide bond formation protein B [Aurantiacibacter xanthus]